MGRQTMRMHKDFDWTIGETWWGYLLDSIPCQACSSTGKNAYGKYCQTCGGEGRCFPKVQPPGYQCNELPSWFHVREKDYGWQMWENTSEGSPISPVCDTPETLARWLVENKASAFGGRTATYDEWLAAIPEGYTPSGIYTPQTGLISGIEGASLKP